MLVNPDKDKGPPAESISLTSKPKGLVRLPPSIDHCFDNLTVANAMGSKTATATLTAVATHRYCGDTLHF